MKQSSENSTTGKEIVLKTLTYFDIFNYPLTLEEIRRFLNIIVNESLLEYWINQLKDDKKIFSFNGYYSIQNNPLLVHRRKKGNKRAEKILVKASKIGRFLYQFPFVRAIGISGSLSKNYADEKSDIDFFIITKADRLWIARTFMHLYKKLTFLTGKQHLHCMNYYIDETALRIEDQNIFTATEIKTLLPLCGDRTMQLFYETNQWANERLPACAFRLQQERDPKTSLAKKMAEWILNGKAGAHLENSLYRITQNRWKRKEKKGKRNKKGEPMGLITGKHFAKSNPGTFQEKVLALYEQKLSAVKQSMYSFTTSSAE